MKKYLVFIMSSLALAFFANTGYAQSVPCPYTLEGVGSRSIPLTYYKMTNIVFPVSVRPGIRVSRDILVQKVKGTENVLVLKAIRKGFIPTNLSIYGLDGRLFSFELRYEDRPDTLNFKVVEDVHADHRSAMEKDAEAIARKKGFLHHGVSREKMRLTLKGIYLQGGLMWLSFTLRNRSRIAYQPEYTQFFVRERRRMKRTAVQEIPLLPVFQAPLLPVAGNSTNIMVMGFRPFALAGNKKLIVQVAERQGGRSLELEMTGAVLLRAR